MANLFELPDNAPTCVCCKIDFPREIKISESETSDKYCAFDSYVESKGLVL